MTSTHDRQLVGAPVEDAENRVRGPLADHGFAVLIEIDVGATMKKNFDVEMPADRIPRPSNPKMAHQAIRIEARVCTMLPFGVTLREVGCGMEVSGVAPVAPMRAIENANLTAVAGEARDLLAKAVKAM